MKLIITEQQFTNLIKYRLNESVSDVAYHYTNATSLVNILKTNKIFLTPSYGIGADQSINYNKLYSLSLTSARNTATGFRATGKNSQYAEGRIRLEMNGRELNHNYKSKHVDYWQYPRTKEMTQNGGSYDEMEERILSDKNEISPASRYITAIEIFIYEPQLQNYKQIKELAEQLNIPCYFYNNGRDFNFSIKKNAVELPENIDQSEDRNIPEEEKKINAVIKAHKLGGLISYKDENLKNKLIKYASDNGYDADRLTKLITDRVSTLKYSYLGSPQDYMMRELELVTTSDIQNYRSEPDKLIRYAIQLLGYDMKKKGLKTIKEYVWDKAYLGKKTQKQFNEQFYNKMLKAIDTNYKIQLDELKDRSFYDHEGNYNDGNVIELVPEVKTQLDRVIGLIKNYYKEKILTNDDMFRYSFYFAYTEVIQYLNLNNMDYEFAKDQIDYSESNLDANDIWRVIRYTLANTTDFAMDEIKAIQEENMVQQNRD